MMLRCVLLMAPALQICLLDMFNCKHPGISPGISGPVLGLNVKPACKWSQGQDSYSQSSWAKPVVCFHPDCAVFCARWYRWWLLVWDWGLLHLLAHTGMLPPSLQRALQCCRLLLHSSSICGGTDLPKCQAFPCSELFISITESFMNNLGQLPFWNLVKADKEGAQAKSLTISCALNGENKTFSKYSDWYKIR